MLIPPLLKFSFFFFLLIYLLVSFSSLSSCLAFIIVFDFDHSLPTLSLLASSFFSIVLVFSFFSFLAAA